MHQRCAHSSSGAKGFTLAELLIALVILGLIATFSIPKVLQSNEDTKKNAIFKETIASLYQVTDSSIREGVFDENTDNTTHGPYFLSRLNAVKLCSSDSKSEGCWDQAAQGDIPFDDDAPGVILHNGANIVGFGITTPGDNTGRESITIDWNGVAGPNQYGQDQLRVDLCFPHDPSDGCYMDASYLRNTPWPPYQMGPFNNSLTLWQSIFQ